jgi:SNF2 family DNA or RNA helicase
MTATPFNRDPEPLWSQMWLVDHGHSLGETLELFRGTFYKQSQGFWSRFDFKFDAKKKPLLNQFLADSSIEYEANAADLPMCTPLKKYATLPGDAEVYYERAKQSLIESHGNYNEIKNVFLRMRQISSGFVGYGDDETGERAKLIFPHNPKMDALLAFCESIRPENKAIIFFDFTYSGERIVAELKKLGLTAAILHGKTKEADLRKIKEDFNKTRRLQFLVLQNEFGIGLNIQVAKYGLYYESPVSAVMRYQTRRRVERQFAKHDRVFIVDFITRGTMDERILEFHKTGQNLLESLVRGKGVPSRKKGPDRANLRK